MRNKGIVLCSGGLDSTLALIKCREDTNTVVPIFVDYGQYARKREWNSLKEICNDLGITFPLLMGLNLDTIWYSNTPVGSVWNRTMALVGIASMWAYINGNDFEYIAVGSHIGDVGPDIKPGEYDTFLNAALLQGTKDQIFLRLPIADLSIEEIGEDLKHWIRFELMYSCYWDPPCGFKSVNEEYRCPGCRRKTLAMKAAGISDNEFLNFPNGNGYPRTYQSKLAEKVNY